MNDWCELIHSYVEAPEIYGYFKECARKWDCMQYIKLSHKVVGASWDESLLKWIVKVEDLNAGGLFIDTCDVLLSATGILKFVKSAETTWIQLMNI